MIKCDPETGACIISELDNMDEQSSSKTGKSISLHYIGDPMCSWCWGISPTLNEVEKFCEEQKIDFTLTMGGLRAGGGDQWNEKFKDFLRNEWKHIGTVTGQPFGFSLLESEFFDYNTEPACRAVVVARIMKEKNGLPHSIVLKFLSKVQEKFYVDGQDPKVLGFYVSICSELSLNFEEFSTIFNSETAIQKVRQDFIACREWGVRSFPTLLLEKGGERKLLASGYIAEKQILAQIKKELLD